MQSTISTQDNQDIKTHIFSKINSPLFWGQVIFITLFLIASWYFLFVNRAVVELTAQAEIKSDFKIYYRTYQQDHWSRLRMKNVYLRPGTLKYSFHLVNISNIAELRIDPTERSDATVRIYSMQLKQNGFPIIDLFTEKNLEKIRTGQHIKNFDIGKGNNQKRRIKVTSTGIDSQLFFRMPKLEREKSTAHLIYVFLFFAIAFLLVYGGEYYIREYRYIPAAFLVILTLAIVVVNISTFNRHPDEFVHVAAAQYYMDNTLPPAVGDPQTDGTYSNYGYSRLFSINGTMAYLFGGKFALLLKPLNIPDYMAFRYFNIALLAMLFIFSIYNITWRILLVPLLFSPQIWYIFSYFNSDAFSFFLCLWLGWELVDSNSPWNRCIKNKDTSFSIFGFIRLCLLTTLLLFCKKNFYFIGVYLVTFLLWQIVFRKITITRKNIIYAISVSAIAFSLLGAYRLWDASINDFSKKERIMEQVTKRASPALNPNTPKEEQNPRIYMKAKGIPFSHLLHHTKWCELTFISSVGTYGYMDIICSYNYYDYMRYLYISLFIITALFVAFYTRIEGLTLLFLTCLCGMALTGASLYNSWTDDFQPQGRYLLPFVAMISIFYHQKRNELNNIVLLCVGGMIFCGSLYSFISILLAGLP